MIVRAVSAGAAAFVSGRSTVKQLHAFLLSGGWYCLPGFQRGDENGAVGTAWYRTCKKSLR